MTRRIEWANQAINDLSSIPDWRIAEVVAKATRRLAEDGVGFVLHIGVEGAPDEFRLLIPRMRTYLLVRSTETTLYVERVVYRE